MALEVIGFVLGVIPELRQQFKSLQTHLFNFNRGPVRYNDLNDRLNVASKYVETIHDILKEHPGVIPIQTSDIFQNSLTSVYNCLKHSNDMMSMLVQKEIPRRPGTRRTFAYFRPRARANSNADVMSTVETQIKEASNTLQSLADVMSTVETQIKEASNTLQSLVEQLNVFLKIYTQQHTSVAANTEAKYTYGMNTPGLLSKVSLDFATTDANDEPVTPEGKLKRSVLIGTKVTAAASVVPDAFGLFGMAGVGKTTALQGLAHDEEIRLHFVDGVLYMALGRRATERTVMDGISSIMKTTGATDTDRTVEKCALLSDAVNCAVKWFKGRVCLFLVDDMWPTESCGTGYLGELRQLLRSCQASRMAITTRSRAITLSAEQIVDFNVRAPHGDLSRNIFMMCATATLRGEVPAGNNVEFRSSVSTILSLCAGLPIALSIAGSAVALRAKTLRGDFRSACNSYAAELYDVKSSLADEMNTDGSSLSACIELSLKYLQEEFSKWKTDNASNIEHSISDLYMSLCVLTDQACVPLSVLSRMWRLDEERVRDVVNMLCDMSLVRIDYPIHTLGLVGEAGLMVHDLLVQFCTRRAEKNNVRTVWHSRLLEGYLEQDQITCEMGTQAWGELLDAETLTTVSCRPWWSESVPKDGYINGNVARHLSCSGLVTELVSLLLDARWTQLRMEIGGILALASDFEWVQNNYEMGAIQGDVKESLKLILKAMRVSWGRVSEGPSSFLFQVCGRLHSWRRENKIVATYLNSLEAHTAYPYLLPASSFRRVVAGIGSGAVRVGDLQLDAEATEKPSNTNSVYSVATSQDGLRIASGSQDNAVRLWDSRTGDKIGPLLEGHTDSVRCVAFSRDGRHLVSGSEDKTLRVWDAETFSQIADPMKGHAGPVSCVSFSWDGLRIVSGSTDSTIHIWDAQSRMQAGDPLEGHIGAALVASESRDGRHVVSQDDYYEVIIWKRDNQSIVWKSNTWQSDSKRATLTKSVTILRYAVIGEEARKIISSCGQEARHLWPKSFPANVPEVSCEGVYVYSNASGKQTLPGALPSPCNTWKYNGERNLFVAGLKSGEVAICF